MNSINFNLYIIGVFAPIFFINSQVVAQEDWKTFKPQKEQSVQDSILLNDTDSSVYRYNSEYNFLENILDEIIAEGERNDLIEGYRIQIYFSSGSGSRIKAQEVQTDFLSKFPNYSCHIIYQSPNFKVRVGDFRTKLEAEEAKMKISSQFPSSFITKDEVIVKRSNKN